MKVQLLTFPGCPNAVEARERLRRVLESSDLLAEIEEVDTAAPEIPERLRGWGSPTILIGGMDIEGQEAPTGAGCRLYRDPATRFSGLPPEATLRAAVERSRISWFPPAAGVPGPRRWTGSRDGPRASRAVGRGTRANGRPPFRPQIAWSTAHLR